MKKYLKTFIYIVSFLNCLLCTARPVRAITIKNKHYPLPPYQVSGTIHNHGVIVDGMAAIRYQKNSIWYGNAEAQPLYSGFGSLLSLGSGYRWVLNPLWVLGGHTHIEGGKLPPKLGHYVKLNPGVEAHTRRGSLSLNVYLPMSFKNYDSMDRNVLKTRDYAGHKEQVRNYVDPDHLSCAVTGNLNILKNLKWGLGFYGAKQVNNPSIIGGMTRLEYTWNDYIRLQFKYSFDNFHRHYVTLGLQARKSSVRQSTTQLHQLLWSPLERHVAPIQMLHRTQTEMRSHHLFFDSEASRGLTEASYENPASQLNDEVLHALRKDYPASSEKTVLHLSGFFDLATNTKASLTLAPHEHIRGEVCTKGKMCIRADCKEGEICQVDFFKYFKFDRSNLRLNPNDLHIRGKVPIHLIVNANSQNTKGIIHEKSGELHSGTISPQAHTVLQILSANERVIDGRAILRGAVSLNNDTSLSHVGVLPADNAKDYDVHTKKSGVRCQNHAIAVSKQEGQAPISRVAIKNIVVSGWPNDEESCQYLYGIDMRYCKNPKIESVWINHARTALWFEDVQQDHENALKNIYIGHPYFSTDLRRVSEMKERLSTIAQASQQGQMESAFDQHQELTRWLKSKTIEPKKLLNHVKGINVGAFPGSIVFNNLDVESCVSFGIQTRTSSSVHSSLETDLDKTSSKNPQSAMQKAADKMSGAFNWFKGKSHYSTKPQKPLDTQRPFKTSILTISDGLIMSKMLSVSVNDGSHLRLDRCVLGSCYLGCSVKDARLTLVGNNKKDNFVYIHGSNALHEIKESARKMSIIKSIPREWEEKLPNAFCLEGSMKSELQMTGTGVIVVPPKDHMLVGVDHKALSAEQNFYLSRTKDIIFGNNNSIFSAIIDTSGSHVRQRARQGFPASEIQPAQHKRGGSSVENSLVQRVANTHARNASAPVNVVTTFQPSSIEGKLPNGKKPAQDLHQALPIQYKGERPERFEDITQGSTSRPIEEKKHKEPLTPAGFHEVLACLEDYYADEQRPAQHNLNPSNQNTQSAHNGLEGNSANIHRRDNNSGTTRPDNVKLPSNERKTSEESDDRLLFQHLAPTEMLLERTHNMLPSGNNGRRPLGKPMPVRVMVQGDGQLKNLPRLTRPMNSRMLPPVNTKNHPNSPPILRTHCPISQRTPIGRSPKSPHTNKVLSSAFPRVPHASLGLGNSTMASQYQKDDNANGEDRQKKPLAPQAKSQQPNPSSIDNRSKKAQQLAYSVNQSKSAPHTSNGAKNAPALIKEPPTARENALGFLYNVPDVGSVDPISRRPTMQHESPLIERVLAELKRHGNDHTKLPDDMKKTWLDWKKGFRNTTVAVESSIASIPPVPLLPKDIFRYPPKQQ